MTRQAVNYLVAQAGKRAKLRFHVHPHMLRHSTGYYLANRNHDTRLVQDYRAPEHRLHRPLYPDGRRALRGALAVAALFCREQEIAAPARQISVTARSAVR